MPTLPDFDPGTQINGSPHVVILGAGSSRAAFPKGDANGRALPLLAELPDCLELRAAISSAGFPNTMDFESIYDQIATTGQHPALKSKIESQTRTYFENLKMPSKPTLYDYLLLSLRETDVIATFNWDLFLALAFIRNRAAAGLPQLAFLHGNVHVGVCIQDRVKGFIGDTCRKCECPFKPTPLLYPVRNKDYESDAFIANEWSVLRYHLNRAYMLTVFGYSAPTTDTAAVRLMSESWTSNPVFELGQVNIVDIERKNGLLAKWEPFLCRSHYGIFRKLSDTWILRHPRRSCEALAMATLQNAPWKNNDFPRFRTIFELHEWIKPLISEEENGRFTGSPCPPSANAKEQP